MVDDLGRQYHVCCPHFLFQLDDLSFYHVVTWQVDHRILFEEGELNSLASHR